ncbi:hypothetical protein C6P45_004398 [Maudiozyma exigua]|uniref:Uncharacterized protein n=1 Tax=Maudiozyma exigua TaxID=34358 RepID=A0A9P7BBM0_MAUEX|nr:hypothetical protein C6P45_004398 [Kazachstania exigua]
MSERSTRRSTRISRQVHESPVEIEEIEPVVKKQKLNDEPEQGRPSWYKWLSDETLLQLARHPLTVVDSIETQFDSLSKVRQSWEYQYVITWIYNVSESFVTKTIYPGGKAMWKTVNFDEILFLKDLLTVLNNPNFQQPEVEDESEMNMYVLVRLALLRQLGNNKSIELNQWNDIVNTLLTESKHADLIPSTNERFIDSDINKQFQIFYHMIKQIESKNMVFKNYITNNMELFDIIKIKESDEADSNQIMFMTYPIAVIKHCITRDKSLGKDKEPWRLPLLLKNCTVKYEDSLGQTDLVHLDYSKEIDSYLQKIHLINDVISYNFETYLNQFETYQKLLKKKQPVKKIVESFENSIEWVVLSRINSAKLLSQREKNKSMKELMVRRKRSTRLIEKEEETKKKETESHLEDKIDHREEYLKARKRNVARIMKRCKENMWNQLWAKFDLDAKQIKSERKDLVNGAPGTTVEEPLTSIDKYVLPNGINYNAKIILTDRITDEQTLEKYENIEELPKRLCITKEDISEAEEFGLNGEVTHEDNSNDWMFQCACMKDSTNEETDTAPESKVVIIHQDDGQEINLEKYRKLDILNRPIICCDNCHIWQHWECQEQSLVDILSIASVHSKKELDNLKFLTQRDFGTVTYDRNEPHHSTTRRTSRRQHQEEEQEHNQLNDMRPTDRRTEFGECATFICSMCLGKIEKELRETFVPELTSLRAKQKKQHDDREKRKMKKLLEKQQQQQQQVISSSMSSSNVPPSTSTDTTAASTPIVQQQTQTQNTFEPVLHTFNTSQQPFQP